MTPSARTVRQAVRRRRLRAAIATGRIPSPLGLRLMITWPTNTDVPDPTERFAADDLTDPRRRR
jgi:hypothetical protein